MAVLDAVGDKEAVDKLGVLATLERRARFKVDDGKQAGSTACEEDVARIIRGSKEGGGPADCPAGARPMADE